jgi:hypothetical protein
MYAITRRILAVSIWMVVSASLILCASGCSQVTPDRAERMTRGYIYYCDGAGGGGLVMNWSGGVRQGLTDAGYDGSGEMFPWETGMGVMADQTASVEYKRQKASALADKIVDYSKKEPGATIHLMGLSAGTAVVAFALEALPSQNSVQNVVMLSGSLSSGYDLSAALRHVKGKMYIFTSQRDEVLLTAVPLAGTADRVSAEGGTIGLNGARIPRGATSEVRDLYRKIVVVPWNSQFARYGNEGGHTDTVNAAFVQQFIAPLVVTGSSRSNTAVASAGAGQVENPDYARWAKFDPGAWVQLEGYRLDGSTREPIQVRATLIKKDPDRLLIRREAEGAGEVAEELTRSYYVTRHIDPNSHPLTHPGAHRSELGNRPCEAGGKRLICKAQKLEVEGEFELWGKNIQATVLTNLEIPGGIAQIDLTTTLGDRTVQLVARATRFGSSSR